MKLFKTTQLRILSMLVLFAGLTFTSCKNSSTSAVDDEEISTAMQAMNKTGATPAVKNVYISDNTVDTWDPITPTSPYSDWPSTVCHQDNTFGIDQSWSNKHKAYQFPKGTHPWEGSAGYNWDAYWINSWSNIQSVGPSGHNWTKYETEVTGNGDFVVQLLADNCSWIYLDNNLIGYQGNDLSNPDNSKYGVKLDGTHNLTFVIFDGGGAAGGKFRLETTESFGGEAPEPIEPTNQAPVADAGADQTLEATGATTSVTLDGSGSSDPDGDALTYSWSNGDSGSTTTVDLGVGVHTFTLTVSDGQGASDTDEVVVEITDTTAPVISFSQETNSLWPPNHKMVLVATGISAHDLVDGATDVTVAVSSNEAANGRGDGNTDSDHEIVTNFDGSIDVYVRAERSGRGSGRTYTISMSTADVAGNSSSESFEVHVAKSQGRAR